MFIELMKSDEVKKKRRRVEVQLHHSDALTSYTLSSAKPARFQ
jgi:hypothetical protein